MEFSDEHQDDCRTLEHKIHLLDNRSRKSSTGIWKIRRFKQIRVFEWNSFNLSWESICHCNNKGIQWCPDDGNMIIRLSPQPQFSETFESRFLHYIFVIYGGFLKWWYLTGPNNHGYHHLRNHPYLYTHYDLVLWPVLWMVRMTRHSLLPWESELL